mmetsp:Transcript_40751/g.41338  ORF Transcript_40751/g.41338 Transcript_40751/m.41338 type:complete len:261 (+) Transcript_40751:23-805(+)
MMATNKICRRYVLITATTTLLLVVTCVTGFTSLINNNNIASSALYNIIEAQAEDYIAPKAGAGGVALAQESVLKVIGDIKHKPGKAETFPETLLRYKDLLTVDESKVQDLLEQVGSTIICTGKGLELYKDPGETTIKEVDYAPTEAIKDAFMNAASAMESTNLIFNFLGGDDLMLGEVMEAANELVVMLDIPTNTNISFNSLSHNTIPSGTCTITVVSKAEENDVSSFSGVEKAIASGEVYARDGYWYTVDESDGSKAMA